MPKGGTALSASRASVRGASVCVNTCLTALLCALLSPGYSGYHSYDLSAGGGGGGGVPISMSTPPPASGAGSAACVQTVQSCPDVLVGAMLGRQGSAVVDIQNATGARIQVSQRNEVRYERKGFLMLIYVYVRVPQLHCFREESDDLVAQAMLMPVLLFAACSLSLGLATAA